MRGRIGVMSVSREPRGAEGRAARMAVEVRRDPERFRGADSSDRRGAQLAVERVQWFVWAASVGRADIDDC